MSENVLKSEQVIEKAGLAIKILMVISILITITCSLILFEVEIGYLITLILFFYSLCASARLCYIFAC